MTQITHITADKLKNLMQNADLKIFDIREPDEYQREHIIGAQNIPLSVLESYDFNNIKDTGTIVFYCQAGNSTRQCEPKLQGLPFQQVMILDGGISAWKKIGCVVAKNENAPLPIMRQVQIIAGILIILGVGLSFLISPYFALLSGLVGVGLTFAGITGFCGMANLLMKLPYNQKITKISCN